MVYTTPLARLLLLAAVSIYASASFAEMYKWVDAEGNTNYTQSPPPGDIEAKTIDPPPKINVEQATKQLENRQKHLQEARDGRIQAAEQKKKEAQELSEKKAECNKAKARLASYQRPRVNLLDADGNPSRANEDQRQAEIAKSRELIKKLCE